MENLELILHSNLTLAEKNICVYYSEIENDIHLPLPQRSNAHIIYLVGEYPGIYQSQFSIDDRKYVAV
jgi:hypothetical protein